MKKIITEEISAKIKQLRVEGMGYRQIASKLGLKSDTVKKYCKRNNIAGYLGGLIKEGSDYGR